MPSKSNRNRLWLALLGVFVLAAVLLIAWLIVSPTSAPAPDEPAFSTPTTPTTLPDRQGNVEERPAWVQIVVESDGLYRVDGEALARLGIDLSAEDVRTHLSLSNRGHPVPWQVIDSARGPALVFYGRGKPSPYSPFNVYWLHIGEAPPGLQPIQVGSPDGEARRVGWATAIAEEQKVYLSTVDEGREPWLWQTVTAARPMTASVTLEAPARAEGSASLTLRLWSHSEHPAEPDHHLVVRWNGVDVADVTWDGRGWQAIEAEIPGDQLREGPNDVSLVVPGDLDVPAEVVYLDRVEVSYPRVLEAGEGPLTFAVDAGAYEVARVASGVLIWDITDVDRPTPLAGYTVDDAGRLRFADRRPGRHRYVLASPDDLLMPKSIRALDALEPISPASNVDYLVIAHPTLMEAIQPLVRYREEQGLSVLLVSSQDVFDRYGHGLPEPEAIRQFIGDALQRWPSPRLRYVLLVGDASYDSYDYLRGPEKQLIPSMFVRTRYVGETASDNALADVDGDGRPDVALGRFPAQTPEQVKAMVDKTLAYESDAGPWAQRVAMVADDKESSFIAMSERLAEAYLSDPFIVERIYLGQVDDPHGRLRQAFRDGVGIVNYIGHGSITIWAQQKVLSVDDVADLRNEHYPILVNMTCLTGYFQHPKVVSLAEALLRSPEGGVVAALVPTSESLPTDQEVLASAFYEHLTSTGAGTIGDVFLAAKRDMPLDGEGQRDVAATFNLLGDPALRLPW